MEYSYLKYGELITIYGSCNNENLIMSGFLSASG